MFCTDSVYSGCCGLYKINTTVLLYISSPALSKLKCQNQMYIIYCVEWKNICLICWEPEQRYMEGVNKSAAKQRKMSTIPGFTFRYTTVDFIYSMLLNGSSLLPEQCSSFLCLFWEDCLNLSTLVPIVPLKSWL